MIFAFFSSARMILLECRESLARKSQPCIPGEYVGLVFLLAGGVENFGLALVSCQLSIDL